VEVSDACCIRNILNTHGLARLTSLSRFWRHISNPHVALSLQLPNVDFNIKFQKETAIFDSPGAAIQPSDSRIEEPIMLKMNFCCLLSCLLLVATIKPVAAQQADQPGAAVEYAAATQPTATRQADPQAATVEKVKIKIAKLGVGAKAKATIKLKDGTKTKGYIAQAGDETFVIRDRKTDAPTTIHYTDVAKVEENRGHSTARNIAIGVGIGVGALLLAIAISIAHLD
jgi:hypothetical protein